MTKELLHRPDVVAVFQKVRGKRVPEGMAGRPLPYSGGKDCLPYRTLDRRHMKVVPNVLATRAIAMGTGRREEILP